MASRSGSRPGPAVWASGLGGGLHLVVPSRRKCASPQRVRVGSIVPGPATAGWQMSRIATARQAGSWPPAIWSW